MDLSSKDLIVFDLDGTLAESKMPMDAEMVSLFSELLNKKKVAVIGGGRYELFREQLIRPLSRASLLRTPAEAAAKVGARADAKVGAKMAGTKILSRLFLFPTTSTRFYRNIKGGWKMVYELNLSPRDRRDVKAAFREVFRESNYKNPKRVYGRLIEDRGSQITFSALGQDVVKVLGKKGLKMKLDWVKKNSALKLKLASMLQKKLPSLEVRAAGQTSIDVTEKGIDKEYGLHQIEKYLKVPINKMVYIGDAIFPGGNDYAVTKTGIDYFRVKGPEDTKAIIKKILKSS